ncbi:MAG: hypothetical protein GPJ54_01900 [Candidatus Heimdallarchaeota archaeon]|nr:hypothetical protein [Candidatus Heimdallarchaeota archaeon]
MSRKKVKTTIVSIDHEKGHTSIIPIVVFGEVNIPHLDATEQVVKVHSDERTFKEFTNDEGNLVLETHFRSITKKPMVISTTSSNNVELKWSIKMYNLIVDDVEKRSFRGINLRIPYEQEFILIETQPVNHQLPFQLENGKIPDKIIFFITRKDLVIGLGKRIARSIIESATELAGDSTLYSLTIDAESISTLESQFESTRYRTQFNTDGVQGTNQLIMKGNNPDPLKVILELANIVLSDEVAQGEILVPGETKAWRAKITDQAGFYVANKTSIKKIVKFSLSYILPITKIDKEILPIQISQNVDQLGVPL